MLLFRRAQGASIQGYCWISLVIERVMIWAAVSKWGFHAL
jgi:hypothetical protein